MQGTLERCPQTFGILGHARINAEAEAEAELSINRKLNSDLFRLCKSVQGFKSYRLFVNVEQIYISWNSPCKTH
jgi:hypothetical protein